MVDNVKVSPNKAPQSCWLTSDPNKCVDKYQMLRSLVFIHIPRHAGISNYAINTIVNTFKYLSVVLYAYWLMSKITKLIEEARIST